MKILFVGDYSNLHACLARELRRRGHQADVLSDRGAYMGTHADFYLARTSGMLGGAKYLYRLFNMLPRLEGYDVVQLINPNFLSLRPGKIKYFFDHLRRHNGSMFLTLAGNDYFFVKACFDASLFRFSEFRVGKDFTRFAGESPEKMYGWISDTNRRWNEYVYENIDGAMSVLPEYDMVARRLLDDKVAFTNIPVDLSALPFCPGPAEGKIKIFVGMRGGMEIQKGTSILLNEARKVESLMPDEVEVENVVDLPLDAYLRRMRSSHIVLDQLYAYSPATNALQAMAMGKVVGTGAQPEYYSYVGNPEEHPLLTLDPCGPPAGERLEELVRNRSAFAAMGRAARELVEKNNDVRVVAGRFISHWESGQRCPV